MQARWTILDLLLAVALVAAVCWWGTAVRDLAGYYFVHTAVQNAEATEPQYEWKIAGPPEGLQSWSDFRFRLLVRLIPLYVASVYFLWAAIAKWDRRKHRWLTLLSVALYVALMMNLLFYPGIMAR